MSVSLCLVAPTASVAATTAIATTFIAASVAATT